MSAACAKADVSVSCDGKAAAKAETLHVEDAQLTL